MAIVAKFFREQAVVDTPIATSEGASIPERIAWMPKGVYHFGGIDFDCTKAGCYRFWDQSTKITHTRLVYAYPQSVDPDLYGFLSGVSWHHSHDTYDAPLAGDVEALAKAGHDHAWGLKCGDITKLARWFLTTKYGLPTRQVNLTTLEPLAIVNGHIVPEVEHGGKWKLWDLSNGVIFMKSGIHLSAAEVIEEGVLNCDRVRIDGAFKRGACYDNGVCTRSMTDMVLRDGGDWWFRRMYQSFTITA